MENIVKLKAFKTDALVKIEVGAGFVQRIQQLFFWYVSQKPEEAVKAIESFKTKEPENDFEHHLLTLVSLIYEFEGRGEEQGLLEDREFNIPQQV